MFEIPKFKPETLPKPIGPALQLGSEAVRRAASLLKPNTTEEVQAPVHILLVDEPLGVWRLTGDNTVVCISGHEDVDGPFVQHEYEINGEARRENFSVTPEDLQAMMTSGFRIL